MKEICRKKYKPHSGQGRVLPSLLNYGIRSKRCFKKRTHFSVIKNKIKRKNEIEITFERPWRSFLLHDVPLQSFRERNVFNEERQTSHS
jgi:hypothetical protein